MDRLEIIVKYGEYLLENGKEPSTVYKFSKELGIPEVEFYQYFSGFKQMNAEIFKKLWDDSVALSHSIEDYFAMDAKEQLLNFYFILFENLKMNRSLILLLLGKASATPDYIAKEIKVKFDLFISELDFQPLPNQDKLPKAVNEFKEMAKNGVLWKHFLAVLMFWRDDHSANFRNTDIYIEKTIDTGFEVASYQPAQKIIDLAKFIWKEKGHKI